MNLFREFWGRWAGWEKVVVVPLGPPRGTSNWLQPARTPALRRPKSRKRAPRRVLGIPRSDIRRHFRTSKDELRSTLGHRRARQVSDPAALIKVVHNNSFPGVGGSGRRPSRIQRLPRKSAFGAFWQLMWHGWPVSMVSVELIWYSLAHNSSPGQTHEC